MRAESRQFENIDDLSRAAADVVCAAAADAVSRKGLFCLCLAGGKTVTRLYQLLAAPPWKDGMPWTQTQIFWGDERCVPALDSDSNYGLASRILLNRVPLTESDVHPMAAASSDMADAALLYENLLRDYFPGEETFDLILLGAGADGHTASLYPRDPALSETKRWVLAVDGRQGNPPLPRLTLTLPAINAARAALFLTAGQDKKPIFESARAGVHHDFPATMVRPRRDLKWFWAREAGAPASDKV